LGQVPTFILPPGWPDWANFSLLDLCLLWEFFESYRISRNFGLHFSR
jgi:hypothetical protein